MHLGQWENAEKELALSSGAFVIAGCFSEKNKNSLIRFLGNLMPFGAILFSITMISFGIDLFLYAKDVAEYIELCQKLPSIPITESNPLCFWCRSKWDFQLTFIIYWALFQKERIVWVGFETS
jgi:hypothetical protein